MRRATTPTHIFTFPDELQVSDLADLLITYGQAGKNILIKRLSDATFSYGDNSISITLSQDEANLFEPGKALVQIRAKTYAGVVVASQIIVVEIKPVLDSEVL